MFKCVGKCVFYMCGFPSFYTALCNSRCLLKSVYSLCFVQYLPVSVCVMFDISWSFVSCTPFGFFQFACPVKTSLNVTSRDFTLYLWWRFFWPLFVSSQFTPPLLPPHFSFLPFKKIFFCNFIIALAEQMLGFLRVTMWTLPHNQICIQSFHPL